MYTCEICQRIVPPHTPATLVVLQTRRVQYPARIDANRPPRKRFGSRKIRHIPHVSHDPRHDPRDDPGGRGFEIVKEARACPECAAASLTGKRLISPTQQRE